MTGILGGYPDVSQRHVLAVALGNGNVKVFSQGPLLLRELGHRHLLQRLWGAGSSPASLSRTERFKSWNSTSQSLSPLKAIIRPVENCNP